MRARRLLVCLLAIVATVGLGGCVGNESPCPFGFDDPVSALLVGLICAENKPAGTSRRRRASVPHQTPHRRSAGEWVHTRSVLDSRTVWRYRRSPTRRVALEDDPVARMGVHAGMPARARVTRSHPPGDCRDRRIHLERVQTARLLETLTR
jgi:hypothetical protein